ncbi:hypothetical protein FIBSPDRAFT_366654 [Athelia psychrophila]|uniref:Integral membrane protein n=1 Tax=Athelia psychrophila TaxID=1759441 RepID=A0A166P6K2_9AGAM|nr:hypothetical protein FIBSPDRAFT_366654 [Fibularhizoctonia sp. CBS 109695]
MASVLLDADSDVTVQLERQTQVAAYIILCSLTAVLWDWVLSSADDCKLVQGCGHAAAMLAYFLARASAITVCILALIFYTGVPPGEHSCSDIFRSIGAMTVVGIAAKAYLFLLRVRAVYGNSKLATLCVGMGMAIVVASRTTVVFMVRTSPLGHGGYCAVTDFPTLPVVSLWLNLAYDTCIFISISARLVSHTTSTPSPWNILLVRGNGLPRIMHLLLLDGQLYYCTTLTFLLVAAIVAGLPVGAIYQAIYAVPAISMETIMTCKVFRAMILRSLDAEKNMPMALAEPLNATLVYECDTAFMELRPMDHQREHIW